MCSRVLMYADVCIKLSLKNCDVTINQIYIYMGNFNIFLLSQPFRKYYPKVSLCINLLNSTEKKKKKNLNVLIRHKNICLCFFSVFLKRKYEFTNVFVIFRLFNFAASLIYKKSQFL